MLDAKPLAGFGEGERFVAAAVVGHDAINGDAEASVIGDGRRWSRKSQDHATSARSPARSSTVQEPAVAAVVISGQLPDKSLCPAHAIYSAPDLGLCELDGGRLAHCGLRSVNSCAVDALSQGRRTNRLAVFGPGNEGRKIPARPESNLPA